MTSGVGFIDVLEMGFGLGKSCGLVWEEVEGGWGRGSKVFILY